MENIKATVFARDKMGQGVKRFLVCDEAYEVNNQSFKKGQIDVQELGARFPISGLWRRPTSKELRNYGSTQKDGMKG